MNRFFCMICCLGLWLPGFGQAPSATTTVNGQTVDFRQLKLTDRYPVDDEDAVLSYAWPAPQACQLSDGSWILAYNEKPFRLTVVKMDAEGHVQKLYSRDDAAIYGLAAKGTRFAALVLPFERDKDRLEKGQLFIELYNDEGRRLKQRQLSGMEDRKKERTQFRHSFNASIQSSEEGWQVFYNFFRDNGKYSGEYNRWITVGSDFQVRERIENYNRDLRNQVGCSGKLEWAVHLPTRNPRGLLLQVYDPEQFEDDMDIGEYILHEVKDGQEKESHMCRDAVMPFAMGDAVSLGGKVYISFADAFGKKDYDGGILEVDPQTGKSKRFTLPAPAGSQASVPRLGVVNGQLLVLQKELPAARDQAITTEWRRNGKPMLEPEREDVVTLRLFSPEQMQGGKLPGSAPVTLNWLEQPLNEMSTCVYQAYRDLQIDMVGMRAFQGKDEVLLFDLSGSELRAWMLSSGTSADAAAR